APYICCSGPGTCARNCTWAGYALDSFLYVSHDCALHRTWTGYGLQLCSSNIGTFSWMLQIGNLHGALHLDGVHTTPLLLRIGNLHGALHLDGVHTTPLLLGIGNLRGALRLDGERTTPLLLHIHADKLLAQLPLRDWNLLEVLLLFHGADLRIALWLS
uniref:Uncharacterized protein n=1 Tax=Anopheles arabiensis TaxID=7173 RepID=A0A182HGW1_ANOAR